MLRTKMSSLLTSNISTKTGFETLYINNNQIQRKLHQNSHTSKEYTNHWLIYSISNASHLHHRQESRHDSNQYSISKKFLIQYNTRCKVLTKLIRRKTLLTFLKLIVIKTNNIIIYWLCERVLFKVTEIEIANKYKDYSRCCKATSY